MKYLDGRRIRLGDVVRIAGGAMGSIVFSADDREYSEDFPEAEWGYLNSGVMINSDECGLIYISGKSEGESLELVERRGV